MKTWKHLCSVLVGLATLMPLSLKAAERIDFYFGPLGLSISVDALETFARTGTVERELRLYLNRLSPEQQEQFRNFLQARYRVDPVLVYRFSHTSVGERLLRRIGEIVNLPKGTNGFYGIRGALVQAAAAPQGLSVIGFLQKFPTDIQLNTEQTLKLIQTISTLQRKTNALVAQLAQSSSTVSSDLNQLPDLRTPGRFSTTKQTLTLRDVKRDRLLVVDLYRPQPTATSGSVPVIVVSNGLGAERDRFQKLGQHLASYGFAVAIPDHPGSDGLRQRKFLAGLYQENFDATEFIDRPLDTTFVLDQLEQLNASHFQGHLDLQQVGVYGYSFGGTTALSLAGAKINFEQLAADCEHQGTIVNISLLYQCRALELPQQTTNLQDSRIQAVFLSVPFGNSLFGEAGISRVTIPVLWQTVDQDFITPLLLEHVPLFTHLPAPDKYLVVSEGLPHAPVILPTDAGKSVEEIRQVANDYQNALSTAFFKIYVAQDKDYQPTLQPAYIQAISQDPYFLNLVESIKSISED
ncbi:MAG: alpha/beta hydrolase [Cyanophyceae cyanobacterium]